MTNPTKASELSSADFDLFWGWLTYTKGSKDVARTAENSKLIRIFSTLDMFQSNSDMNEYIKSWETEKEFTVYSYELRTGLMKMTDAQFLKFYRFIIALQVKARENAVKLEEKKKAKEKAEKQRKEEEERASAKKQRKGTYRPNKSAAIHPCEDNGWEEEKSSEGDIFSDQESSIPVESNCEDSSEARNEVDTTLDPSVIKSFKSKYKIEKKTSSSSESGLFGTFVSFLKRSFSSRSSASGVFSARLNKTRSDSFRHGFSADESDAGSEDGFSQRLTRANLSILREEICGDDAINSYRRLGEPSEIEESLKSFGVSSSQDQCSSFEQISSRDYHSTFERVSSRDLRNIME